MLRFGLTHAIPLTTLCPLPLPGSFPLFPPPPPPSLIHHTHTHAHIQEETQAGTSKGIRSNWRKAPVKGTVSSQKDPFEFHSSSNDENPVPSRKQTSHGQSYSPEKRRRTAREGTVSLLDEIQPFESLKFERTYSSLQIALNILLSGPYDAVGTNLEKLKLY